MLKQDFSKKISIVINKELPNWQILNTVAHIAAYMGNKMKDPFDTGDYFLTKDEVRFPRNSQFPIIVLSAKPEQLPEFAKIVRQSDLLHIEFIREMIETTNDEEIINLLKDKIEDQIEYLGIGIFGDNETVKQLTKKFKLWS